MRASRPARNGESFEVLSAIKFISPKVSQKIDYSTVSEREGIYIRLTDEGDQSELRRIEGNTLQKTIDLGAVRKKWKT
jgi:hypothetical protein